MSSEAAKESVTAGAIQIQIHLCDASAYVYGLIMADLLATRCSYQDHYG